MINNQNTDKSPIILYNGNILHIRKIKQIFQTIF